MIHLRPICCMCEEYLGVIYLGLDWYCADCAHDHIVPAEPDEVYVPHPADLARDDHERWMEEQHYAR